MARLNLVSQITDSSVSVNTANGKDMGVPGDVKVTFMIGKKHYFTHRFVVYDCLSRPFISGEEFLHKHRMTLDWAEENKHALGYRHEIIAVASQPVTDKPLKLRNAIKIPPRNFMVPPVNCSQIFTGKAMAIPCDELKHRFPNIYMEPMQMNNSECKSCDTVPYMIINLDYEDPVYIGKDMPLAYIY